MTVREMLARCDSRELAEWQAYERVCGPLGGERDDVLAAIVSAVTMNAAGPKNPAKVDDFLPEWDRKPQTWQEQLSIVQQLNKVYGGREVTR